jgi:hypothetical protein
MMLGKLKTIEAIAEYMSIMALLFTLGLRGMR